MPPPAVRPPGSVPGPKVLLSVVPALSVMPVLPLP